MLKTTDLKIKRETQRHNSGCVEFDEQTQRSLTTEN